MGCIREDQEEEYKSLVRDLVVWCKNNHLQINTSKTKELVIDYRKSSPPPQRTQTEGANVEVVRCCKYLRTSWTGPRTLTTSTRGSVYCHQCPLLCCGVLGRRNVKEESTRLDRLIRRTGSVVSMKLDSWQRKEH